MDGQPWVNLEDRPVLVIIKIITALIPCLSHQVRVPVPGRPASVQFRQPDLHGGDPGAGGARAGRRVRRAGRAPRRARRGATLSTAHAQPGAC